MQKFFLKNYARPRLSLNNEKIDAVIVQYGCKRGALMHVLMQIQNENHLLPKEILNAISDCLDAPLNRVMQNASFYKIFSLTPKGRAVVYPVLKESGPFSTRRSPWWKVGAGWQRPVFFSWWTRRPWIRPARTALPRNAWSERATRFFFDAPIQPGKNVLFRGSDVSLDQRIVASGQPITPVIAGLLAAGGYSRIPVRKTPKVGITGTGNEIVLPCMQLQEGQLYASNILALAGWCRKLWITTRMTKEKISVGNEGDLQR